MKTAVDFLINQWLYLDTEFEMGLMDKNTYWQKLREIQTQAKEIEKKQIMDAFWNGDNTDCTSEQNSKEFAEQYYNKTFKSK
jgi:hypothetical protein